MDEPIKLPAAHPIVRRLLALTFPEYRGRRIFLERARYPVDVRSYWSEGSRSYFAAVDLTTLRVVTLPQNGTPYDDGPIAPNGVVIPPGRAIVEHAIRGSWQAIYVHVGADAPLPDAFVPALPAAGAGFPLGGRGGVR